ncbi:hypothetical protein D1164_23515, partial [Mariniphaga sediminis]
MNLKIVFISVLLISALSTLGATKFESTAGFTDANAFGFSAGASGIENVNALQKAIDKGGTIVVSQPG